MERLMYILKKIVIIALGILIWYSFIALCAWDLNPGEWSGFARFFLAIMSIFVIIFASSEDF